MSRAQVKVTGSQFSEPYLRLLKACLPIYNRLIAKMGLDRFPLTPPSATQLEESKGFTTEPTQPWHNEIIDRALWHLNRDNRQFIEYKSDWKLSDPHQYTRATEPTKIFSDPSNRRTRRPFKLPKSLPQDRYMLKSTHANVRRGNNYRQTWEMGSYNGALAPHNSDLQANTPKADTLEEIDHTQAAKSKASERLTKAQLIERRSHEST
jgi:hypothetical protein